MTAILVRILRLLAVLLLLRLAFRVLFAWLARPREASRDVRGGELVRDRVCNTFLPRDRALTARVGGKEEHFCSARCRDQALAAVSRAS